VERLALGLAFITWSGAASAQPAEQTLPRPQDDQATGTLTIASEPSSPTLEPCEEQDGEVAASPDEPCQSWCGRYPSFEEKPRVLFGVDLLPEIGTSAGYEDNHVRHLSLNLLGGFSGGLEGVELSSLFAFTTGAVYGLQLGGLLNLTGSSLYGMQAAGLVNAVSGTPRGVQLAGALNTGGGVLQGLQLAGAANVSNDGVEGVQVAGAANLAGGLHGVQLGGALNVLDAKPGSADGAQLGAVNITTGGVEGLQLGAVNISAGKPNVQIGIVNIAEQTDFSVGLVSVLYGGRAHVDAWFTETGFAHVGVKHGGRWFHNIYGVGMRNRGPQASLAWGLGTHLPLVSGAFVDLDLLAHALVPTADGSDGIPLLGTLRVAANVPLDPDVSLIVGPSYNVLRTAEKDGGTSYPLFADHVLRSGDGPLVRVWPGFVLGLQFLALSAQAE
jgi:hypothetical protein